MLLLFIVLLLLFGGGGLFLHGTLGTVLLILFVVWLVGGVGYGRRGNWW